MKQPIIYLKFFKWVFLLLILTAGCRFAMEQNKKFKLTDDNYIITSFLDNEKSIHLIPSKQDSTNVIYGDKNSKLNNIWEIYHISNHIYEIRNAASKRYLSVVKDATISSGYRVVCSEKKPGEFTKWFIHKYEGDKFKIINKSIHHCLFVRWVNANNLALSLQICNNVPNEYWQINRIDPDLIQR